MERENHLYRRKSATLPVGCCTLSLLFYAAGLIPYICQFGREFFRFGWLLSDKNLNALKTSRYKTFPSRLAMAWRLNIFISLLLSKKIWFFWKNFLARAGDRTHDLPVQRWSLYHMSYWGFDMRPWKSWGLYSTYYQIMLLCAKKKKKQWRAGNHYTVWPCWKREIHLTFIYF